MSKDTTLKLSRVIRAPRAKVFRAWTEKEMIEKWYGPEGFMTKVLELDARAGGEYRFAMHSPKRDIHTVFGTFNEIMPPEKLVFSWQWEGGEEKTTVSVEFKEKDGATEILFTHGAFGTKKSMENHKSGWESSFKKLEKI